MDWGTQKLIDFKIFFKGLVDLQGHFINVTLNNVATFVKNRQTGWIWLVDLSHLVPACNISLFTKVNL